MISEWDTKAGTTQISTTWTETVTQAKALRERRVGGKTEKNPQPRKRFPWRIGISNAWISYLSGISSNILHGEAEFRKFLKANGEQ